MERPELDEWLRKADAILKEESERDELVGKELEWLGGCATRDEMDLLDQELRNRDL